MHKFPLMRRKPRNDTLGLHRKVSGVDSTIAGHVHSAKRHGISVNFKIRKANTVDSRYLEIQGTH